MFTIFGKFKGGKGVLTALGVLFALLPMEAAIACLVFIITFGLKRIVSLGSIVAAVSLSVTVVVERYLLDIEVRTELILTCLLLTVLVIITHRSNIKRLVAGTELTFKKPTG